MNSIFVNVAATIIIFILLVINKDERKQLKYFLYYYASLVLVTILMGTSNVFPKFITIIFANMVVLFSRLLLLRGIALIKNIKIKYFHYMIVITVSLVSLIFFTYIRDSYEVRVTIMAASIAMLHGLIIYYLYRKNREDQFITRILITINIIYFSANIVRVIYCVIAVIILKLSVITSVNAIVLLFDSIFQMVLIVGVLSTLNNIKNKKIVIYEKEKRGLLSNIPGFAYRCKADRDWTMEVLSDNFKKVTGYEAEDVIKNNRLSFNDLILDKYKEEVWKDWNACIESNKTYIGEYKIKCKDGKVRWLWERGNAIKNQQEEIFLEGYIMDITERKNLAEGNMVLEAQIREQQRMAAIGTLARGLAHEINNPINGIINYGQLLYEKFESNEEERTYAEEIINEGERIGELIKNLLKLSNQEKKQAEVQNLSLIIDETAKIFNNLLTREGINLEIESIDKNNKILFISGQLELVLLNLLTNSEESIKKKKYMDNEKKRIKIFIEESESSDEVRLVIEDNGEGIKSDLQETIFEPFFTTKNRANNAGLGLSNSFNILQNNNSSIFVKSEPNECTRFYIDIPVAK